MQEFDYMQLVYLVVLGSAIGFWFFIENRHNLGRTLRQATAWGLIFLGVIAAIGLWGDIRQTVRPQQAVFSESGRIELPRAPDGHYYATLQLNDAMVTFVVDTGATAMVLSKADAQRAGLDPADLAYFSEAMTANGAVRTAPVTLDRVALGPFVDRDVPAYVNDGAMDGSLLGMAYLQRYSRIEIAGGKLVLER